MSIRNAVRARPNPCHCGGATKIESATASGNVTTVYFDNSSGFMIKQEGAGADGKPQTVLLSEYKKVGATTSPHEIAIETAMANIELTVASVELNAEIDDRILSCPPKP